MHIVGTFYKLHATPSKSSLKLVKNTFPFNVYFLFKGMSNINEKALKGYSNEEAIWDLAVSCCAGALNIIRPRWTQCVSFAQVA